MTAAAGQIGRMYCRRCGYDLRLLPENRCPECGGEFDPESPRTFRRRPHSRVWPWVRRVVVVLILLTALPASAYGWLWWGWHQEEQTLAQFSRNYRSYRKGCPVNVKPIGPPWLAEYLGPRAFILDRVEFLYVFAEDNPKLPLLRRFRHIERLTLNGEVDAGSLSHLAGLAKLHTLDTGDITGPPAEVDRQYLRLASLPAMKALYASGVSAEARQQAKASHPDLKFGH